MIADKSPIELFAQPFFTEEQMNIMLENWHTAQKDHHPVVKLSLSTENKASMCWLIYVLDPEYPDLASGLCDHGWGQAFMDMIDLPYLLTLAHYYQTPLLRDPTFRGTYPLSVYAEASTLTNGITTDDTVLAQAAAILKQRQKLSMPRLNP